MAAADRGPYPVHTVEPARHRVGGALIGAERDFSGGAHVGGLAVAGEILLVPILWRLIDDD